MENQNKSTQKTIIGIVVIVLLASFGAYTMYQNSKLNDSKAFLEEEKASIEQNLDEMVAKYDAAIEDNSSLNEELKLEREDILLLRDSVQNLKQTNYSIIRRYRKKIESLEKSNQELFRQNDSLRVSNQVLANDLNTAQDSIVSQSSQLDVLNMQNDALSEKVGIGSQLKVSNVKTVSMKKKLFGDKLAETTRANRTDALRINFTIVANDLAEKGERIAHIQVLDPKGNAVSVVGTATLEDGTELEYTDTTSLEYDNADLAIISLVEVERKAMVKGTYTVRVYLDAKLVALSGFVLN